MKKVDLKNKIKSLIIELEELELPKKVIDQIIEDTAFESFYIYYNH